MILLVKDCLLEVHNLNIQQKREYLMEKIRGTILNPELLKEEKRYCRHNWKIGVAPKRVVENVCRTAFQLAYGIGKSYIEVIVRSIKDFEVNLEPPLDDRAVISSHYEYLFIKMAEDRGLQLTRDQLAALRVPNSPTSVLCYSWMLIYFDVIGDLIPNSDGEIHIEPTDIKEIWAEYKEDTNFAGESYLCAEAFGRMWDICFPHVKIREYKAVTGKCGTCGDLSHARRTFRDSESRTLITYLHAMHRTFYMGERFQYGIRRRHAMEHPNEYCSIISDGMAQGHCELPWLGQTSHFSQPLVQHFQGCLNHGRNFTVYRTFHNVMHDSNAQLHSFLLCLEQTAQEKGGELPDTVYYQIDGGSENTATIIYGMCELIVAKRLTQKIVLTRLPVGHTHEDIDGRFGVIWVSMRTSFVLTPQKYKETVIGAFAKNAPVQMKDLWVIPDYAQVLKPCMDRSFQRYAKMEWTQLQFIFQAVPIDENFPLGVKTTYRRYSADKVCEVVKTSDEQCGFQVKNVITKTYPPATEQTDTDPARPEGMYLLSKFPNATAIRPVGFKVGSRAEFDRTMAAVRKKLPKESAAWEEFARDVPDSDDAQQYLEKLPGGK